MFAKLKKKIAEEAATTSRAGGAARMPRSISKESITSVGADSGDDFPSDGSSSREDLSSQLFRRNEQIRKLEVKLSDYAEQVRNLQKIKEKLEHALETHQDSFVKKLQEQNEAHQASAAKMAEGVALALEKKDQEWKEKLSHLEKERDVLSAQLQERTEQSLILFQKRDELDELEGFQQQELAKVKHMVRLNWDTGTAFQQELASSAEELARAREAARVSQAASSRLSWELQELKRQHADLRAERDELLEAEESAENKITTLERRAQELQTPCGSFSPPPPNCQAQVTASDCKKRLETLQGDHGSLKAEYERHKQKAVLEAEEKARLVGLLQDKVATLEKRFEGNLSGDEHVRELLGEKSTLEERLEEARRQLSAARSSHAESVGLLETQIDRLSGQLAEGQARLSEQEELVRGLRESRAQQQKDLERALRLADDVAAKSKEEVEGRDRQVQKLQTELELERTRLREGLSVAERRWAEQVRRLEEQGAALEAARESERAAVQRERGRAERENEELRARCDVLESSLKSRGAEVERLTADLGSATERAKHLEEEQKQKEALQRQVADLTSSLKEKDALIVEKTDLLLKEEEALSHLRQGEEQ
ncbi:hypothetical protein JRQ81_008538 [Phrynocephalus forsythii]|uniref:Golgin subfamily A member 1 n=1 Tax=Phrynocephalus forsythii TaxID=171643 RepID=A0A9Q0XAU4_9SAUR|nr:hypothetical protein JRQ81_008538 [Phrynocephalus forsythii]